MIEFGPNGPTSPMFGSGNGTTRDKIIRLPGITIYPDSSDTVRDSGIGKGVCRRCKRTFISGPGYERTCKPCSEVAG